MLRLYDTVNEKVIESHINNVELWDHKFVNSAEGLTKIAETDNWKYPIDGILGIALAPEDDSEPQALPLDCHKIESDNFRTNTNICSALNGRATKTRRGNLTPV